MIRKQVLILIFLILSGTALIGQEITWAVSANMGFSQVLFLDLDKERILFEELELENLHQFTYNYGTSVALEISDRIQLETGLSFFNVKGKFTRLEFQDDPILPTDVTNYAQTYYLGFPTAFNIRFNKFIVAPGIKTLFFISGEYVNREPGGFDSSGNFYYKEKRKDVDFKRFDLGLSLGLRYMINDTFSVNTDYYYGLNNMFENTPITGDGFSRRNRMITLGMSYYVRD